MTTFAELLASTQHDRVRDWTRTGGTGPFTVLNSPPAGYSGFSSYSTGAVVYYCIVDTQGRWGTYRGVWTLSTLSVSVAERLDTSTGAEIDWDADTKQIFTVLAAENIRDILDEIEGKASTGHTHEHDTLGGLADDDHTQYHTDARALTWLGTRSTTDLAEGANLYFTNERVDDRVAALIQDGSNIAWTYDDVANTLTANVTFSLAGSDTDDLAEGAANLYFTDERAQDAVGGALTDSTTIDFTYDDGANTITAVVIDDSISDAKLRNSAAVSVIGRSANSSGDPADIAAAANDRILRRVSNALDFGQLTIGMFPDALITKAKIENVAADRLLGRGNGGGAGAPQEISLGTNLSLSGTTLNAAGGTGSLIPIERKTGSAVASYDFVTGINSTYRTYKLIGWLRPATDDVELWTRFSDDGSTFEADASDYSYQLSAWDHSGTARFANSTGDTKMRWCTGDAGVAVGNAADERITFEMTIHDPSTTGVSHPIKMLHSYISAGGVLLSGIGAGRLVATDDILGIQLLFESGNIAAGDVTLYALANA